MLNYGERILSREFGLVLAHELGHSFGSYHDPIGDTVCSPGDENGHYLMYPYANDIDEQVLLSPQSHSSSSSTM
jgi:disintegrin and metalloproteinase domain-containing protein 10